MKFNLLSSIDTISWIEAMSERAIHNNDYKLAVAYKDSIIKLSNIELEKTLSFNLIHKEKEFLSTEKDHYQFLSSQREKILWLETISVVLIIVILIILFISMNNKKSYRIERQEEELEKNRIILKNISKSMEEKEETITSLEKMVEAFNHKLNNMDQYTTVLEKDIDEKKQEINRLDEKYAELSDLRDLERNYQRKINSDISYELKILTENLYKMKNDMNGYRLNAVRSYRKAYEDVSKILYSPDLTFLFDFNNNNREHLDKLVNEFTSDKSLERMTKDINLLMENIINHIMNDFQLEEKEKKIMIYSLAGFNYKTIAKILNVKPTTLASTRTRLYKKILSTPSENSEIYRKFI